jgi:4'-phosphopantetheinyl transferase
MDFGDRALTIHCAPLRTLEPVTPLMTSAAVRLWYTPVTGIMPYLPRLEAVLDEEERQRAERFRFAPDRERFIAGHGLLRMLLGGALGVAPEAVRMARGAHGKPHLPGGGPPFNLSDTKDALVVAIGGTDELGVDIETVERRTDHELVAGHYFTPDEVAHIQAGGAEGKRRFLTLWTRKEAVLKASGVGIMDDLHALRVLDGEQRLTIRHETFVREAAPAYHVSSFSVGATHLIALATPRPHAPPALHDACRSLG